MLDHLVDVARGRVEAGPVGDRLAHGQVLVDARALQHDSHARAQVAVARRRVVAEHGDVAAACGCGSPPGSPPWWSCPRRSGRAARRSRRGAPRSRCRGRPRARRSSCGGPRTSIAVTRPSWQPLAQRMLCACIDIGSNTTRVLVADVEDGGLREVLQRRAFTRLGKGLKGGEIPREKIEEVARVVAEQRHPDRATRRRRDARRRHGGDPRGGQPGRVRDGDARRGRRRGRDPRRRRRRRGSPSSAPRARSAQPLDGTVGVVDVGGGLDGARDRHGAPTARRGRSPSASARACSTDAYLRSDPPVGGRAARDARARGRRVRGPRAARRSTRRWRSAAAPRRCAGSSAPSSTRSRCSARCACSRATGRGGSRPLRDRPRARVLMAAGLTRARRGARRRSAGRSRSAGGGLREGILLELAAAR